MLYLYESSSWSICNQVINHLGFGDGQGGLAYCDSWGRKESDTTEQLNWTEIEQLTEQTDKMEWHTKKLKVKTQIRCCIVFEYSPIWGAHL